MIELWQLAPSFNSRKVRFALGLKGATYTTIDVGEADIASVVEVSGQPLTPVLRHDGRVMFDSGAIVRYIDANIPGPRLFSSDVSQMRAIEDWETRSRQTILVPYLQIMGQVRSGKMDAAIIADGKEKFLAGATLVESSLNEHGVLVGETLGAADIFCGCYLAYGFLLPEQAQGRPPLLWSLQNLALGESMPVLGTWFEKLRKLDR